MPNSKKRIRLQERGRKAAQAKKAKALLHQLTQDAVIKTEVNSADVEEEEATVKIEIDPTDCEGSITEDYQFLKREEQFEEEDEIPVSLAELRRGGKARIVDDQIREGSSSKVFKKTLALTYPSTCFVCQASFKWKAGVNSTDHYEFFLSEMLELPEGNVVKYLKQLQTPQTWIGLCSYCQCLVQEGGKLKERIAELECQVRRCKQLVLGRMKDAYLVAAPTTLHESVDSVGQNQQSLVLEEIRKYVNSHNYSVLETTEGLRPSKRGETRDTSKKTIQETIQSKLTPAPAMELPSSVKMQNLTAVRPKTQNQPPIRPPEAVVATRMLSIMQKRLGLKSSAPKSESLPSVPPMFISQRKPIPCPSSRDQADSDGAPHSTAPLVLQKKRRSRKKKQLFPGQTDGGAITEEEYRNHRYDCPYCPGVKRYTFVMFVQHLIIHQRRPYRCVDCSELFSNDEDLKEQHWKTKHSASEKIYPEKFLEIKLDPCEIWKCKPCITGFFTPEFMSKHEVHCTQQRLTIGRPRSCLQCGKRFPDIPEWRIHRALKHPEVDSKSCLYCDESFAENTVEGIESRHDNKLVEHLKSVHNSYRRHLYECDTCGLIFTCDGDKRTHCLEQHGIPITSLYPCNICSRSYSTLPSLRYHMTYDHFQSETSICDVCGVKFKQLQNLLQHKLQEHGIEPQKGQRYKVMSCVKDGCDFKFVLKGALTKHIELVHNPRQYKCRYCEKSLKTQKSRGVHEQIHKNKNTKPFQCAICGNSFAVRNYLYIHHRLSHEKRTFPSYLKKRPSRKSKGSGNNRNIMKKAVGNEIDASCEDNMTSAAILDRAVVTPNVSSGAPPQDYNILKSGL